MAVKRCTSILIGSYLVEFQRVERQDPRNFSGYAIHIFVGSYDTTGHRMTKNEDILLYSVPPSFYSQIARLTLAEKGIKYRKAVIIPGPPNYEAYQPWYMRLNPMGTVPTLVVDGLAIDDSRKIIHFVDEELNGPSLFPAVQEVRTEVEHWIQEAYQIPERELAYGNEKLKQLGERTNKRRLEVLKKHQSREPDMKEVYGRKIEDIMSFMRNASDAKHFEEIQKDARDRLDWADQMLADRQYCVGETYSAADIVWTVTVARQLMLKTQPFENRPSLEAWYQRMKDRPSYTHADIWERFKPEVMLPVVLWKFKWPLFVAITSITLASFGLISWLSQ